VEVSVQRIQNLYIAVAVTNIDHYTILVLMVTQKIENPNPTNADPDPA